MTAAPASAELPVKNLRRDTSGIFVSMRLVLRPGLFRRPDLDVRRIDLHREQTFGEESVSDALLSG